MACGGGGGDSSNTPSPSPSPSAMVFFEDDFEGDPSDWLCTDGPLSQWEDSYGDSCTTTIDGFGALWKMGPGRNSSNAVYSWKKMGLTNGYRGEGRKWFTGSDVKTDIYHRWYMRIPPADEYNKVNESGFKFWRYLLRERGYSVPPELYLNAYPSDTFATVYFTLLDTDIPANTLTLVAISEINDNHWHCFELHMKLNSSGNYNGIVEFWLDGTLKASRYNINWGYDSAQPVAFHNVGIGIGNVSDSDWYQTEWSAIGFDDIAVSTTRVGCN